MRWDSSIVVNLFLAWSNKFQISYEFDKNAVRHSLEFIQYLLFQLQEDEFNRNLTQNPETNTPSFKDFLRCVYGAVSKGFEVSKVDLKEALLPNSEKIHKVKGKKFVQDEQQWVSEYEQSLKMLNDQGRRLLELVLLAKKKKVTQ